MAFYSLRAIYIGNFAPADTNQSNTTNENDDVFAGTYTGPEMEIADLTLNDSNNSGQLNDGDMGTAFEGVSYSLMGSPVSSALDAEAYYLATVVTPSGTSMMQLATLQMTNGDTFVYSLSNSLDNLKIVSITMPTTPMSENYMGPGLGTNGMPDQIEDVDNSRLVCFTSGTAIRTPRGDVAIEDLRVGDLVTTMDNGSQQLRWIGRRHVSWQEMQRCPTLRPIAIHREVLGADRDLLVSPQHGMLTATHELIRAKHLAETSPGVRIAHGKRGATYMHLMFDAHQVIFAEGAPTESFYPGKMAVQALDAGPRDELFALFPELRAQGSMRRAISNYGETARRFLKRSDLRDVVPLLEVGSIDQFFRSRSLNFA